MEIAEELDLAMKNHRPGGISQAELSRVSGVPQPTISRILKHGGSTPETKTIIKLAKALKCVLGGIDGRQAGKINYEASNITKLQTKEPDPLPAPLDEILKLARAMSTEGQYVLLGRLQELAKQYPAAKANHSN